MSADSSFDLFDESEFFKRFSLLDKSGALLCKEKVFIFETIDSTNTYLLNLLNSEVYAKGRSLLTDDGKDLSEYGVRFNKMLVSSAEQTAGRGRMGRSFYSPAKSGIYFSFVYVQKNGVVNPSLYTITSVVGICRAIEKLYGAECSIKWVNDIYLGSKKICGILTEGITNPASGKIECAVVGIGINISVKDGLPLELKDKAGGILEGVGLEKNEAGRSSLLAECMFRILRSLDSGENIMAEYKKRSMLTGKTVTVSPVIGNERHSYKAKVLGIGDDASLLVQKEDGTRVSLSSGEVSLSL